MANLSRSVQIVTKRSGTYIAPGWTGAASHLTDSGRDLFRVQLAEDSQARIWAVWSEQRDSNWDLFGRAFDGNSWGEETQLTSAPGADIFHSLARDGKGNLYLAWQFRPCRRRFRS